MTPSVSEDVICSGGTDESYSKQLELLRMDGVEVGDRVVCEGEAVKVRKTISNLESTMRCYEREVQQPLCAPVNCRFVYLDH